MLRPDSRSENFRIAAFAMPVPHTRHRTLGTCSIPSTIFIICLLIAEEPVVAILSCISFWNPKPRLSTYPFHKHLVSFPGCTHNYATSALYYFPEGRCLNCFLLNLVGVEYMTMSLLEAPLLFASTSAMLSTTPFSHPFRPSLGRSQRASRVCGNSWRSTAATFTKQTRNYMNNMVRRTVDPFSHEWPPLTLTIAKQDLSSGFPPTDSASATRPRSKRS